MCTYPRGLATVTLRGLEDLFFYLRKVPPPIRASSMGVDSAQIWLVICINNSVIFYENFLLNPIFFLAHRNSCLEGMNDGQMTPRAYPNFNSYVNNLCFLVFRMDR
jgi:hypothetical protein